MKKIILGLSAALLLGGCQKQESERMEQPSHPVVNALVTDQNIIKNSVAYKLAMLTLREPQLPTSDPMVTGISDQLEKLSKFTGMSDEDIGNIVWYGVKEIKKDGKDATPTELLDMLIQVLPHQKYDQDHLQSRKLISYDVAQYIIARTSADQNHVIAVHSMIGVIDGLQKMINE